MEMNAQESIDIPLTMCFVLENINPIKKENVGQSHAKQTHFMRL